MSGGEMPGTSIAVVGLQSMWQGGLAARTPPGALIQHVVMVE